MKAKTVNEHALDNYSKFRNYLVPIKEKLINSLKEQTSHAVKDKGDDIISIATGDKYSTLVKVLGHDTMNESLNETRFSALEISFNRKDVKDKSLDAKFYIEEIENNLIDVDLTSKGFKFDEAFSKLKKCLDDIAKATENHVEKNNTDEGLNNRILYKEDKNKAKSNKYPLLNYNYQ